MRRTERRTPPPHAPAFAPLRERPTARCAGRAGLSTLSTFLREELGLTGTKIVCAEGDCGSCTVLLGRPNSTGNSIRYQPVCSCIQYLLQLDATHIITVEGLAYDGQLNPVQEAMVAENGAQCGFCTPGFVTAMCSILDEQPMATDHDLCRGLVGISAAARVTARS